MSTALLINSTPRDTIFPSHIDDKMNDRESQEPLKTTDRSYAHLLVSVSEAPSPVANINFNTFSVLAGRSINWDFSSSRQITADHSKPCGLSELLPTWASDLKGMHSLAETPKEATLGRDKIIKDKKNLAGVSAMTKPAGMDMVGAPVESPSHEACK
eukprot:6187301-Pleurochrysis_carterae.AAC.2